MPLSDIFTNWSGILSKSFSLLLMSTSKVSRFLLLTPITSISLLDIFFNSSKEWISTNTSRPKLFANELNFDISFDSKIDAMSNIYIAV